MLWRRGTGWRMKQIQITDPRGEIHVYSVDKESVEIHVGRSSDNDIVLNDPAVSRQHAIIRIVGSTFTVVNRSSLGVVVGGKRIDDRCQVTPGVPIEVGPYTLELQESADRSWDAIPLPEETDPSRKVPFQSHRHEHRTPVPHALSDDYLPSAPPSGVPAALGIAQLELGLRTLRTIGRNANFVCSPASLAVLFGSLWGGARGPSRTEIEGAFGWIGSGEAQLQRWLDALDPSAITDPGAPAVYRLANALWFDASVRFVPGYPETWCGGAPRRADFSQPSAVAGAVNDWVSALTDGFLPRVIEPSMLNPSMRLLMANALYLKARWETDLAQAAPVPFHNLDGSAPVVRWMTDSGNYRWARRRDFEVLSKPYRGCSLEFVIVLPDEGAFESVAGRLTGGALAEDLNYMSDRVVSLGMPYFTAESGGVDPKAVLQALGVQSVFEPRRCDLRGISPDARDPGRELFVGRVIHHAKIEVDERGTEAAAFSAMGVPMGGMGTYDPPVVFWANRPFLYLIRDEKSGMPLFVGQTTNLAPEKVR